MLATIPELQPLINAAKNSDGTFNFFATYQECTSLADELIHELDSTGNLPVPFHLCNAKRLLTVLRYPKRMPLKLADWLVREAKEKFFYHMDLNNKFIDNPDAIAPQYCRDYPIVRMYKKLIHSWLDEILPPVWWFDENPDPFTFSPGAVADACTNPFCKWFRAEHSMRRHGKLLPIPVIDPVAHRNPIEEVLRPVTYVNANAWGRNYAVTSMDGTVRYVTCPGWNEIADKRVLSDAYYVKPITVPKQINAVRVVCPERAYNARLQNHIDKQLRKWWERIHLDKVFCHGDQEVNRERAWRGSLWNNIATIDSTAASDTVHRDLIDAIDHPTLTYLMGFMPTAVVWGRTTRWLGMFGTMGSPLTFDVEMIIFYIAVRLGMVLHDFGLDADTSQLRPVDTGITVVGDDIAVKAEYAEIVLQVLTAFNMRPNSAKTFIEGHYKESCGGEYVDGNDVSGTYWPRGLSVDDVDNTRWDGWRERYTSPLISLVSHCRDLASAGFDSAAESIRQFISEQYDLGFGLDPTAEWPDTITGNSLYAFEDQAGSRRFSSILSFRENEAVLMYSPHVTWLTAAKPKSTCWCQGVPDEVLEMLLDEWRYYSHDTYVVDHEAAYSMRREPRVHMVPRTTLELSRHN
jgi:hypothetical protein